MPDALENGIRKSQLNGQNDTSLTLTPDADAEAVRARALLEARHALRQPLAALSIYTNMLKPHVAARGQPMLANIDDCIANLNHLISTLLAPEQVDAQVSDNVN